MPLTGFLKKQRWMSRGYDWTAVLEVLRVAQSRNIDWR